MKTDVVVAIFYFHCWLFLFVLFCLFCFLNVCVYGHFMYIFVVGLLFSNIGTYSKKNIVISVGRVSFFFFFFGLVVVVVIAVVVIVVVVVVVLLLLLLLLLLFCFYFNVPSHRSVSNCRFVSVRTDSIRSRNDIVLCLESRFIVVPLREDVPQLWFTCHFFIHRVLLYISTTYEPKFTST